MAVFVFAHCILMNQRKFNVVSNTTGLGHSSEYSRWTTRENPHGVRTNPAMDLMVSRSLSLPLSFFSPLSLSPTHTQTRTHTHTHTITFNSQFNTIFYLQHGSRVIASLQIFILKFLQVTISLFCVTFRGPCIVMYSYNEGQRDALFLKCTW
jgi:hypothetical protein